MSQLARALAISRKDMESYYAKPPLVTWALLFPAVLLLALYLKDRAGYLAVAPGILAMTLLFGNTSMAAVVVTFEKRAGTLERLLLAPVTARTIVVGKAASAALYGVATSAVLTAGLVLLLGFPLARPGIFAAGLLLGAGTFSFMGLIASVMVKEVFEAMTLMNFFRFPLLFVSGVFMPLAEMPGWIRPVAYASPLTYVVELLRFGAFGRAYFPSPWVPLAVLAAFLAGSYGVAGPAFRNNANR
jgi:ABC-2 type transport system permease protein